MLSGPNAELIKQLWQQQSGYEKPKLRSMVWRSYRGIQAEIHRQILPAEVWSAVLVCRKSRLLFMCGPWTRCSTWCNSQECEHHVYQHQSDAGNMGNNCQNPSSAQHNLNCRWVLHENDFTPPHPRQELYFRSKEIRRQCKLTQSISDYIRQLSSRLIYKV